MARRMLIVFAIVLAGTAGGVRARAVNPVSDQIPGIGKVSNGFVGFCSSYGYYGTIRTKLAWDFVGHLQHGQDPDGHNYFVRSGHASGAKFCEFPTGANDVQVNLVEKTPTGTLKSFCYGLIQKEQLQSLPPQTARALPPMMKIELVCDQENGGRLAYQYFMHVTLLQSGTGSNGTRYRGYVQTDLGWCVGQVTCLQQLP